MIKTTLKIILVVGGFLLASILWVGLLNLAFQWLFLGWLAR